MSDALKEVIAVIRPERWRSTQSSIYLAGGMGVTQKRVLGRGRQAGLSYMSMVKFDGAARLGYLPKRIVRCVVEAENVPAVVKAIIKANQTGNPGDGKIFVCPIEESVRIRTGETGKEAL
jgi:nitrogen regulatory protein PII 2